MNKLIIQDIKSKGKKCYICCEQATAKVYCDIEGEKYRYYLCDSCFDNTLKEWMSRLFGEK